MKKIVYLLLLLLGNVIYGSNYLICNNEIVLFYDETLKCVAYMRSDITSPIDISRVEPMLIMNGKDIVQLKDHMTSAFRAKGTNILQMKYDLKGRIININIFPSLKDPKSLYFVSDLSELSDIGRIDMVYHIVPEKDNLYVDAHDDIREKYTSYGNISFKGEGNDTGLYFVRGGTLDQKVTELAKTSSKLHRNDNMYYVMKDVKTNDKINFVIRFDKIFKNVAQIFTNLVEENKYWDNVVKKNDKDPLLSFSLNHLRLFTSRKDIPSEVSRNIGKETPQSKVKILFISALYGINFNEKRFLDDITVRKSDVDYVTWFIYFFEYLTIFKRTLTKDFTDTHVVPQVLSLSDRVDDDGSIINGRDYSKDYYMYYKLLDAVYDRPEFSNDRDMLIKRRDLVKQYLIKNYYNSKTSRFKNRKIDKNTSYKNIDFYDIFSKEKQISVLKNDLKSYKDPKTGLLKSKSENYIDLEYNLDFLLELYRNDLIDEGDRLRHSIEKTISAHDYCIMPMIGQDRSQYPGIYSELVYLYLLCAYIRGDGYVYQK